MKYGGKAARGTGHVIGVTAVSYTHLDVYKRQVIAIECVLALWTVYEMRHASDEPVDE